MDDGDATPFFLTHHAPVGAWSSFTFGMPGSGVSIDHEIDVVAPENDFKVALVESDGTGRMLPFIAGCENAFEDFVDEDERKALLAERAAGAWEMVEPRAVRRTLRATTDSFSCPGIALTVYTSMMPVPDATADLSPAGAICPAILIDVVFDNTDSDREARGYIGLHYRGRQRIRPLDWSSSGALCGVGLRGEWALAAVPQDGGVFTVRENRVTELVAAGSPHVHNSGNEGGVLMRVPAREKRVLTCAVGFYHGCAATQGLVGTYWYTRYFDSLESVCSYALSTAEETRTWCAAQDRLFDRACADPRRRELFYQSVRAYYANTQFIVTNRDRVHYNVCEGRFLWRNTIDLAADHLPWELYRNPWVTRSIADDAIDRYSYRDRVTFAEEPGVLRAGGLTFCHDMGSYTAFSPSGYSGYERFDMKGYEHMTTEELLNGIYLVAGYALASSDQGWIGARATAARDLLESLENRDHFDAAGRDGLLKGRTDRGGSADEITTYDALDHALKSARGNIYIAVKTWCAALMLERFLAMAGDCGASARAGSMAARSAGTLVAHFDGRRQCFPANVLDGSEALVIAAVEPLGVPVYCGLRERLGEFADLMSCLRAHALSCLREGACVDSRTGGLRLSSGSVNTWPSKVSLCLFALEDILGIRGEQIPASVYRELRRWFQVAGARTTLGDQIDVTTAAIVNGTNYPRMVTTFLWFDRATLGR